MNTSVERYVIKRIRELLFEVDELIQQGNLDEKVAELYSYIFCGIIDDLDELENEVRALLKEEGY